MNFVILDPEAEAFPVADEECVPDTIRAEQEKLLEAYKSVFETLPVGLQAQ